MRSEGVGLGIHVEREFVSPREGRSRRGVTLVEALVGLSIFALLFTVFWQLYQGARQAENYYQPGMAAQQDLTLAMTKMVEEIREGLEIYYPAPPPLAPTDFETKTVEGTGIGFINVKGEPIVYYLEDPVIDPTSGKAGPRAIRRAHVKSKKTEVVVGNVKLFKVIVPPHRAGKKLARANLELSVLKGREEDPSKLDRFDMITAVFLRNVSRDQIE